MKTRSSFWPRFKLTQALFLLAATLPALADSQPKPLLSQAELTEKLAREVDQAAVASQSQAINKLQSLIKKNRGGPTEATLLIRLAEAQQQAGSITFRVAHAKSHFSKKTVDLGDFKKVMKDSVNTLSDFLSRFPKSDEVALALFLRGKSYEEIDEKVKAEKDYLRLINTTTQLDYRLPALMSLAEFCTARNEHPKAIHFLKQVAEHPASGQYPFSLYKLAWSHYNLKQIPEAMKYAETHIRYYNEKKELLAKNNLKASSPNEALRESMLLDSVVFLAEGYELTPETYSPETVFQTIRVLEKSAFQGKMLARYSKLLRSHGHETDLITWNNLFIAQAPDLVESVDSLNTIYEHFLNRQKFDQTLSFLKDYISLFPKHGTTDTFKKGQQLVLDTATQLHGILSKNKLAGDVTLYSTKLAKLYGGFTEMVPANDPRIPRAHYNLAEALFDIKEFSKSAEHYRWVVEFQTLALKNTKPSTTETNTTQKKSSSSSAVPLVVSLNDQQLLNEASLKSISARYEDLKQRGLIQTNLKPVAVTANEPINSPAEEIQQWLTWIDNHPEQTSADLASFEFEADRYLYSKNHLNQATSRLLKFVLAQTNQKEAPSAALLILDSFVLAERWADTENLAYSLSQKNQWKKLATPFEQTLNKIAAKSAYKQLEISFKQTLWSQVITKGKAYGELFNTRFGDTEHTPDVAFLMGMAHLSLSEKILAENYLKKVIASRLTSIHLVESHTVLGQLALEKYLFKNAADHWLEAQKLKPSSDTSRLLLSSAWLSHDQELIRTVTMSKLFCTDTSACNTYADVQCLFSSTDAGNCRPQTEFGSLIKRLRPHANQSSDLLNSNEVTALLKQFKNLPPELQFETKASIEKWIGNTVLTKVKEQEALNRSVLSKPSERTLKSRVKAMGQLEQNIASLTQFPWPGLRANLVDATAELYSHFSTALRELAAPPELKGSEKEAFEGIVRQLSIPFEEKAQDLRARAFEIASSYRIKGEQMSKISTRYFKDNPSLAKTFFSIGTFDQINSATFKPQTFDQSWLHTYLTSSNQQPLLTSNRYGFWKDAIQDHDLARSFYFLIQIQEKDKPSIDTLALLKTVTFETSHNHIDAIAELETGYEHFSQALQIQVASTLFSWSFDAYNKSKMVESIDRLEKVASHQTKAQQEYALALDWLTQVRRWASKN